MNTQTNAEMNLKQDYYYKKLSIILKLLTSKYDVNNFKLVKSDEFTNDYHFALVFNKSKMTTKCMMTIYNDTTFNDIEDFINNFCYRVEKTQYTKKCNICMEINKKSLTVCPTCLNNWCEDCDINIIKSSNLCTKCPYCRGVVSTFATTELKNDYINNSIKKYKK